MSEAEPTSTARERAADTLGVRPTDGAGVARAAFLRKLPAENLLPPEDWAPAVNELAGTTLPVTPDAQHAEDEAFREEVAAFARRFWELDPAARRQQWEELSARCRSEYLPAAADLRRLEPALDLTVTPNPTPEAEELAGLVRELFVLRPRERAVRRAALLVEQADDKSRWARAAALLRKSDPDTAALEPVFLSRTTTMVVPATIRERKPPSERERAKEEQKLLATMGQLPQAQEQPLETGRNQLVKFSGCGWVFLVALWFGSKLIMGLSSSSRPATPPPPPPAQSAPWNPPPKSGNTEHNLKVRKWLEDRQKQQSGSQPARPQPNLPDSNRSVPPAAPVNR